MRRAPWLLLILALLLPGTAAAADMDYYTWNAFDETVSAFQRVALVLRDPGFTVFVMVFAVAGILIGGLLVGIKGVKGQQVNPVGFLIPALIGVALFRAFIWPTGTLFVYDPVRNDTAAVGDVPDAVVIMAGLLNKVERGVREIVETASADPAAERAGALRYSLVLNALNARGTNISLERNLVNYYLDCGLPAMSLGYNGASQREAERDTEDLYATFAKFAHPSLATYAYTGSGDATATMTCQTMWTDVLNPVLGGAAGLSEVRDMVCARTGFNMAVAAQQSRCDEELTDLSALFGVTSATDWLPFIRSTQIAVGMTNALRSGDISVQQGALIDRQVMSEGIGVAEALDRWVPKLKGFMTASVLGMLPLVLLFVVTPMVGKALQLGAGLFVWLTLWGICDAIAVTMAADAAADAFDQVARYGFSHTAFLLSPENAVAALGVFGKARSMALMMATVLAYGLFQFGGYAFTSIASSWQHELGAAGQNAGRTVLSPEERGALLQRLAGSPGTEATLQQYGMPAMAGAAALSGAAGAREVQRAAPYVTPTLNSSPTMSGAVGSELGDWSHTAEGQQLKEAATNAGGLGYVPATVNGIGYGSEGPSLFGYASDLGDLRSGQNLGELAGRKEVGGEVFDSTKDMAQFRTEQGLSSALSEKAALTSRDLTGQDSGAQTGRLAAGATLADRDLLGRVQERDSVAADSAEAAELLARQQRTSLAGAIDGASIEESITASREGTARSAAFGEVLAEEHMARNIGRTEATSAGMHSRAFDTALDAFGRRGVQSGATHQQLRTAAEGVAMGEGGNMASLNMRFARLGVGEKLGHSEVVDLLGRLAGVNTTTVEGIRRLSVATEGARQSVTLDADPAARERVIEAMGLDENTARALRAREDGFRLGVALNSDGSIAYGNIESGGQVYLVDRTSIENSFSEVSRSSLELGGGRAQFDNAAQFEQQLDRVFEGSSLYTGIVTQRVDVALTAMSQGLSQYMTERGLTLDASSAETVQHSFGGGGKLGLAAPNGQAPVRTRLASNETPQGGTAEIGTRGLSPLDAGISGRFESTKQESDGRTAGRDLRIDYARDALMSARAEAVEAARGRFGTFNEGNETAVRAAILQDMRVRVVEKLSQTRDAALEETAGARSGHDVEPDYAIEQRKLRDRQGVEGDQVSTRHGEVTR